MINKDERIIEQEEIEVMLKTQFDKILNSDIETYKGLNLKITYEQQFVREKNKNPNTIYIVYKLSPFALDYGQAIMPITLVAISEHNNLNRCHRLLMDFSQVFNIGWNEEKTMKQFWESPQDVGNFEEIYDGFRSLFYVSGALVVSKNANFCELSSLSFDVYLNGELKNGLIDNNLFEHYFYDFDDEKENYEFVGTGNPDSSVTWTDNKISKCLNQKYIKENNIKWNDTNYLKVVPNWDVTINYLTFAESTDIQVDSQVFQTTRNFAKSVGMSGVNTLNVSTYLLDDNFCNKCLGIKTKDLDRQPDGVDTKFYFRFKFKNGYELKDVYKLVGFSMTMQLKEIPAINVTFTN